MFSLVLAQSCFLLLSTTLGYAADITDLPGKLQTISSQYYPSIADIGRKVWANPETATEEHYAHDIVTSFFSRAQPSRFKVTPHAYGFDTAFKLEFVHRPAGFSGELPTFAYLAEYDALPGIGHACGHNLILTVGLAAAEFSRQALIDYNLPGRVLVYGTFDEEDKAGKSQLLNAGAFADKGAIYMLAHPSISSSVSPMGARINAVVKVKEESHTLAVQNAYKQLVIAKDLSKSLPGHSSTISPVSDIGVYAVNVVQTSIQLGVTGVTEEGLNSTLYALKTNGPTFSKVTYTLHEDANGIAITFTGPGGHASEGTQGALSFSVETFRALTTSNISDSLSFYTPSNTSHNEFDITVDLRTRYTHELDQVRDYVHNALNNGIPDSITYDLPYPALEVHPDLGNWFTHVLNTEPTFADANDVWSVISVAPAATDASFLQNPTIDETSYELLKSDRVVFHPSFDICAPGSTSCPFNHEPEFAPMATTDYAFAQAEKAARAFAYAAIELANNATFLDSVLSITRK
ncbi:hypothetical protein DL96DRAFT_1467189 [Flagelloscypha sp. PMI_526]|nr:hypothetical protein DL96DRAFT_1467189 [Flagelloscypha sp. PMI_526]